MPRLLTQLLIFTALVFPMRQGNGWRDCTRLWRWAGDGEWTRDAPWRIWELWLR